MERPNELYVNTAKEIIAELVDRHFIEFKTIKHYFKSVDAAINVLKHIDGKCTMKCKKCSLKCLN